MEKTKICTKCGNEYPATEEWFHKNHDKRKGRKEKLRSVCKSCIAIYNKGYYNNNIEKFSSLKKQNYNKNREKEIQYSKDYAKENREKILQNRRKHYQNNKERLLNINKEWKRKNAEHYLKGIRKRYAEDKKFRLSTIVSGSIYRSINNSKLGRHWETLVDFTLEQLINHLESLFKPGMSWDNYGKYGWHIDHKRPISSFNFEKPEDPDFKECWSLDNLQPLWAEENLRKHAKW